MRWWRSFKDKISGSSGDGDDVVGPRRRKSARYGYRVNIAAKCSSWPRFLELFTGDVSQGGLFVPTTSEAEVGEGVKVELGLPDGSSFAATGIVVNCVNAAAAQQTGRPQGIGIRLNPPEDADKQRFDELLAIARADQPVPEAVPQEIEDAITKTGSVRLSAVHKAAQMGAMLPESAAKPVAPKVRFATESPEPREQSKPSLRQLTPAVHTSEPKGRIVGVDLGTTYTSIATVIGKKVSILHHANGGRSSPSVVSFDKDGSFIVGAEARERVATDPAHTVVSPKRLLGRDFQDREVQTFLNQVPYRNFAGPDGQTVIEIWGQQYPITQVCSFLLNNARQVAETELGEPVTHAVVSVPISFDKARVSSIRRAAQMAQLELAAIIDEPSAAALANRFDPNFGGTVGVYDFGGGTFDFSIVDVSQGDFRVLATSGDTWLGGDDFDQVLAEAAANQFWRQHKVDLRKQAVEWQKLLFACERAKRVLSQEDSAIIKVPNVLRTAEGMVNLKLSLDRKTFRRASAAIVERSLSVCKDALRLVKMQPNELTAVYLSGGTTYIPVVREAIAEYFNIPIRTGVPPEHAVCLGAAIHAAQLQYRGAATLASR